MSLKTKVIVQRAAVTTSRLSELTTVFNPPCPITWLLTTTKVPSQFPAFPTTGPSSCDPPSWVDNISQKGFAYYSPAICPSGFFPACTANDERTGEGFPPISAGETAMYCVPSGFSCTSDTTDFRGGVWGMGSYTASGVRPAVTVGPAIQIRWREQDLSSLQTDPLDPGVLVNRPSILTVPALSVSVDIPLSPSTATASSVVTQAEDTTGSAEFISLATTLITVDQPTTTFSPSMKTHPDRTSSGQSGISSTADGNTPIPTQPEGSTTAVASSTVTAATALSGVLIAMIIGILAIITFRRYRTGKIKTFPPFHFESWTEKLLGKWKGRLPLHQPTANIWPKMPRAELGVDGPIPELGPGSPLGTKENPAELTGDGVRNSWMSQVSRMFAIKLRKDV
ncbi:hypothetical protein F4804DRAFT_194220 [Jackrogersella minutella]|nr:hypothetical protein F4804DRAFT_194220 [Jackrogersella minutella]